MVEGGVDDKVIADKEGAAECPDCHSITQEKRFSRLGLVFLLGSWIYCGLGCCVFLNIARIASCWTSSRGRSSSGPSSWRIARCSRRRRPSTPRPSRRRRKRRASSSSNVFIPSRTDPSSHELVLLLCREGRGEGEGEGRGGRDPDSVEGQAMLSQWGHALLSLSLHLSGVLFGLFMWYLFPRNPVRYITKLPKERVLVEVKSEVSEEEDRRKETRALLQERHFG